MVKGFIFDLDGTLLNTIGDIHKVLNECLSFFGIEKIDVEKCAKLVGNGARKLVEGAAGKYFTEDVYKMYTEKFSESENGLTSLYKDEKMTLSALQSRGIKFAVVTNKPQKATENVCCKLLPEFAFCAFFGQSGEYPLKPDPTATLKAIDLMGLEKEECVFVGDGETDVLTAKNAGLSCISALWGYRSKTQLKAAGATAFAEKFTDLLKII